MMTRWVLAALLCAGTAQAKPALIPAQWSAFNDFQTRVVNFEVLFDRPYLAADGDQVQFWVTMAIGDPYDLT